MAGINRARKGVEGDDKSKIKDTSMKQVFSIGMWLIWMGLASNGFARPELVQMLERIDLAGNSITLEGESYRLAENIRWFGLGDKSPADVLPLMQGRRVGLEIDYMGDQPIVTEIWVQP